MSELKILGYINLPEKKIRPEEYRNFLENKMSDIGREVNEEFDYELLAADASILMTGHPDSDKDLKFVDDLENNWAREQYKSVAQWREAKEKNPSTITEMTVTLLLHHLLGKRFIVARAAAYDDYKNHVDNVIIDKETGAVVCGFDEVLGHEGDDGGEKKKDKINKILDHGGASLKYGATIEDGKIKTKELRNIPTFFLSLSKEELNALLVDLKNSNEISAKEKEVALKMVNSLDDQYLDLANKNYHPELKANLLAFSDSLVALKEELNKN